MEGMDNIPGQSNAHMIYIPAIVFTVISPLFCVLRAWSRFRKGGRLGSDDYLILAALIFSLASSGVMIASCQYGFGQHIYNLTAENKIEALKYFYLCQITYKTSINLTKCSILLLYVRIFGNVRWIKYLCSFLIGCVSLYCIASVAATIFQCSPLPRAFNKSIPGRCIDNGDFWYANAGFSVGTDVIILLVPMPLVYKLQIPRLQKVGLALIFALGGFVIVTSCLRMTTINIAATSPDTTFDIASTMWTIIEMNVAIVCACLPMARPLLVKMFPKLLHPNSSRRGEKSAYAPGGGIRSSFAIKGYYYMSNQESQNQSENDDWTRVGGREHAVHTTTIRKGDQTSQESILSDPMSTQGAKTDDAESGKELQGIQKTVQYSVEYSAMESLRYVPMGWYPKGP
ncbi:hypothetical protein B0H63DRAFT_76543 [Podospora didyma]|uniref:Rhodopsin domain-containing protein n=1 Tax=Podospora didyma TaxID=330526 RepID=A0AAE0N2M7_9PEZI|nr:hypothetical protein B0H63DRAFT_76543 [Podospora didyma]